MVTAWTHGLVVSASAAPIGTMRHCGRWRGKVNCMPSSMEASGSRWIRCMTAIAWWSGSDRPVFPVTGVRWQKRKSIKGYLYWEFRQA